MEFQANYYSFIELINKYGTISILDFLNALYPHFKLYTISEEWINNPQYILKCKGENGDLIVNWIY